MAEISFAPKIIPSIVPDKVTFRPEDSTPERTCLCCGKTWRPKPKHRHHPFRFCGQRCYWTYRRAHPKEIPTLTCVVCQKQFQPATRKRALEIISQRERPFCSRECRKMVRSPECAAQMRRTNLRRRDKISQRMRTRNPIWMPGVLEKVSRALKGRTFLARGGNGRLTVPQTHLAKATGLPTEYAIGIPAEAKRYFQSPPTVYKVDLAEPSVKLAIEVDGLSHRTRKWKFLDARKTSILNWLGWTVLRFTNAEVLSDLTGCQQKIQSTILRLTTPTTILSKAA
jgi:hypothetical protein